MYAEKKEATIFSESQATQRLAQRGGHSRRCECGLTSARMVPFQDIPFQRPQRGALPLRLRLPRRQRRALRRLLLLRMRLLLLCRRLRAHAVAAASSRLCRRGGCGGCRT